MQIKCVVIGFRFNVQNWNDSADLRMWAKKYAVSPPATDVDAKGFALEDGNSRIRVFPLKGNLTVGANQDGGNGGGGDSTGPLKHKHAAIASRGELSFWKIDSSTGMGAFYDGKTIPKPLGGEYDSPPSVLYAYTGATTADGGYTPPDDPGLTFVFNSHNDAYNALLGSLANMYSLYGEVRMVAVSNHVL